MPPCVVPRGSTLCIRRRLASFAECAATIAGRRRRCARLPDAVACSPFGGDASEHVASSVAILLAASLLASPPVGTIAEGPTPPVDAGANTLLGWQPAPTPPG